MIKKVIINHFKKFERLEFDLPDHVVIVGQNNSGKTTLLQAIACWIEFASHWSKNFPDLAREEDGNYPSIRLNVLEFQSVPLIDFDHLWHSKNVRYPSSIWLHTKSWKIGFEIIYHERELADIRPVQEVNESDIDKYVKQPIHSTYIPPFTGLDLREPLYDRIVIPARLARRQGGSILRNMLLHISQDSDKWNELRSIVRSFFGFELDPPSGAAEVYVRYRHSMSDTFYELSSAASGFLQILMVYATLLYEQNSVVLIDEPDAHLHVLLQNKIYQHLLKRVRQNQTQLIIATHSERLINTVQRDDLRVLGSEMYTITDKRKVSDTLYLENVDICNAQTEAKILYIEGSTDILILKEWARILEHPLLPFLECPFTWETARNEWSATRHFVALKGLVPDFRGVELCDSNGKDRSTMPKLPKGMIRMYWERYEIESYLIHPDAITRFVEKNHGVQSAQKVTLFIRDQLPPVVYDNMLDTSNYYQQIKAKSLLSQFFNSAFLNIDERDFYQIAAEMEKQEIHPEVIEKLDQIAEHFSML
ncbi:MAG: AAA family ATPase [Bacteroidetes bacterium]|nr:AAA family ATPase [Bacteroidota bacterium]